MQKEIREFVIVGGGAAGYIAAATLSKLLLKTPLGGYKVTLIESSDIGIIGVGEATIPSVQDLLSFLNIDEADFVRETNATYKLAIRFDDWAHLNHTYYHPFGELGPMIENVQLHQHWLSSRVNDKSLPPLQSLSICSMAAEKCKFMKPDKSNQSVLNWLSYAYHFDAGLVADYLKGYSTSKGLNHIVGTINGVKKDDEGYIKTLVLKDGREISGDFFFDCSGFIGLLIEKELGSPFEDWTKWLPVNRAIAMPCESVSPLTPYTLSKARRAGWTWRIPLQNRIGNGYVYSSDFETEESAHELLSSAIDGKPLADPRYINFKAGRRREQWVKNCLSVGLASGFIEPLESTAIHLVIGSMFRFFDHFPRNRNLETVRQAYNARGIREIEEIRDFIIMHYCTSKRDDTEFWRYVTNMEIPDSLKAKLDIYDNQAKVISDYYDLFRPMSWISVLVGMDVIPKNTNPLIDVIPPEFSKKVINDVASAIQNGVNNMTGHKEFIENLTNRKININ